MRDAPRKSRDQKFPQITVDRIDVKKSSGGQAKHSGSKIINTPRLGGEVGQSDDFGPSCEMRLPIGAKMVFARIHGESQMGTTMVGAHPCSVKRDLRCDAAAGAAGDPEILNYVNQRFARFRLFDGVLGVVILHIEIHPFGAAGDFSRRYCGRILRKRGHRP